MYTHIQPKRTLEPPLEHMARTRAVTEGVRHLEVYITVNHNEVHNKLRQTYSVVGVVVDDVEYLKFG